MEKVVHKFKSFREQEKFELEFWDNASIGEKFEAVEQIRANFMSIFYPDVKGIEKVVKFRKLHDKEED